MREGQSLIDLGRVVGALQRTAGFSAVGEGAGGGGRGDDLPVLVGEARKDGLLVREDLVESHIALVGRDGRGKVDLIVVRVAARRAIVGRGKKHGEQIGGDLADGHVRRVDGRDAIGLVDCRDALAGKVVGEVAVAHVGGGNAEHNRRLARQAQALIADEEECGRVRGLAMRQLDGPAQRSAEVVHDDARL